MKPSQFHVLCLLSFAMISLDVMGVFGQLESPEGASSSGEQGQTSLDESFSAKPEDFVQLSGDDATHFQYRFRSFYFSRDDFDGSRKEAWAMGGWIGAQTSYLGDRISFGVTGYTSQKVTGEPDEDGTGLLETGQEGFTVLGEAYADIRVADEIYFNVGRKEYDTTYINENDSRMLPNTFEAATVLGAQPFGSSGGTIRYGGGYFHRIKDRSSDDFISMSVAAGAPVERGVIAGGAIYETDEFSLGAINYLSPDVINIFYTEMKVTAPISDDLRPRVAFQYSNQRSAGDDLLTGSEFDAHQAGIKAELPIGPALFTTAWTNAWGDSGLRSPWSGYPGFTAVQAGDFNRQGEEAFLYRVAYDFETIPGFSAYALWVQGSDPDTADSFARDEGDLNLQWAPPEGFLDGLAFRVRYAQVDEKGPLDRERDDFRLILNYGREW